MSILPTNAFLKFKQPYLIKRHGLKTTCGGSVVLYEHGFIIEEYCERSYGCFINLFDRTDQNRVFYRCHYDHTGIKHDCEYEFYIENNEHRWDIRWDHGVSTKVLVNDDDLSKSNLPKELLPKELFSKENK